MIVGPKKEDKHCWNINWKTHCWLFGIYARQPLKAELLPSFAAMVKSSFFHDLFRVLYPQLILRGAYVINASLQMYYKEITAINARFLMLFDLYSLRATKFVIFFHIYMFCSAYLILTFTSALMIWHVFTLKENAGGCKVAPTHLNRYWNTTRWRYHYGFQIYTCN